MARIKALCVVAHPDDCVIFAKPFIDTHKQYDWNISHTYGADVQQLVSIYPVDSETFQTDVFKPLKNKWVRIFI